MILYVGPGVGLATTVMVVIVLLIVGISLAIVLWSSIKSLGTKIRKLLNGK